MDANGKAATNSITVTVVPQGSAPTITLSVSPSVVAAGQTANLTWASTNATSVAITPAVLGDDVTSVALSGTAAVSPTASTTYTATATGAGGITASAVATVNLLGVTLVASPATVGPGQNATLTWTSGNAATVSIDQGIGVNGPNGSQIVSPAATTTYTITATNGSATATATATINAPLAVTLKANPANIAPGSQSTLTWASTGAASVSIDQGVPPISRRQRKRCCFAGTKYHLHHHRHGRAGPHSDSCSHGKCCHEWRFAGDQAHHRNVAGEPFVR